MKGTGMALGMVLGAALMGAGILLGGRSGEAHASPQSVDNNGKYAVAVGGTAAGVNDLVWVLNEHPVHPGLKGREEDSKVAKPNRVALCLYKATKNGDAMKLVSVRDIAYDVEIQNLNQETPEVRQIMEKLKGEIARKEKEKDDK